MHATGIGRFGPSTVPASAIAELGSVCVRASSGENASRHQDDEACASRGASSARKARRMPRGDRAKNARKKVEAGRATNAGVTSTSLPSQACLDTRQGYAETRGWIRSCSPVAMKVNSSRSLFPRRGLVVLFVTASFASLAVAACGPSTRANTNGDDRADASDASRRSDGSAADDGGDPIVSGTCKTAPSSDPPLCGTFTRALIGTQPCAKFGDTKLGSSELCAELCGGPVASCYEQVKDCGSSSCLFDIVCTRTCDDAGQP